jgi:FAD/FMN-containing dehydrogenase
VTDGSQVCGIAFVAGDGRIVRYARDASDEFLADRPLAADQRAREDGADGDVFRGAVCALGCLGVIADITLSLTPRYYVQQVLL